MEKFFGLIEVRVDSRQIEKSERGKLPEEREIGFEMVYEFGEVCLGPVDVGKCNHCFGYRRLSCPARN